MATVDSSVELEGATAPTTGTSSDGLTHSMRKNGRFVNPWPEWCFPSGTKGMKMMWKFATGSGDHSNIPSQEVSEPLARLGSAYLERWDESILGICCRFWGQKQYSFTGGKRKRKRNINLREIITCSFRFLNPWPNWRLPSVVQKVLFSCKLALGLGFWDKSNVPDREVLDTTLPIVTPDFSSPTPEDGMKVTWLGHASVLLQFENICVLTDPIFSQRAAPFQFMGPKRYRGPPCSVQDLPSVDVVVISHNHYDHLDYNTVKDLHKRFGEKLCWHVPLGMSSWMKSMGCENVVEQDWWQEERVKDREDIRVVFTPAAHWCKRGPTDDNLVLWGSWCVIGRRSRFFFGGDTGYCHGFKEIGKKYGPFNLAAIPIGAYEPRDFMKNQHVNPEEAVQIHQDVQAKQSLGIHWGTFKLTFEGYLEPRSKVKEAMEAKGLKVEDFFTLDHGGSKVIPIPQAEPSIEKETAT